MVSSTQVSYGEGGGAGVEKLGNKRKKEDKHKVGGADSGKGKKEAMEQTKCPVSETVGTARK
jgi:hypothetical protein